MKANQIRSIAGRLPHYAKALERFPPSTIALFGADNIAAASFLLDEMAVSGQAANVPTPPASYPYPPCCWVWGELAAAHRVWAWWDKWACMDCGVIVLLPEMESRLTCNQQEEQTS